MAASNDSRITPVPTDEEAAAIVAALAAFSGGPVEEQRDEAPRWRWSGRWWSKPVPLRRQRPWKAGS